MKLPRFVRHLAIFSLLALPLFFGGCAGVDYAASGPHLRPEAGKGLVVFYREDRILGSPVAYKVRDGSAIIGGLPNGTYFTYQAAPGQHIFMATTEVTNLEILRVQAGRTYFVRGSIHPGVVIWRPDLERVSNEEGRAALDGLRPVMMRPKPAPPAEDKH